MWAKKKLNKSYSFSSFHVNCNDLWIARLCEFVNHDLINSKIVFTINQSENHVHILRCLYMLKLVYLMNFNQDPKQLIPVMMVMSCLEVQFENVNWTVNGRENCHIVVSKFDLIWIIMLMIIRRSLDLANWLRRLVNFGCKWKW